MADGFLRILFYVSNFQRHIESHQAISWFYTFFSSLLFLVFFYCNVTAILSHVNDLDLFSNFFCSLSCRFQNKHCSWIFLDLSGWNKAWSVTRFSYKLLWFLCVNYHRKTTDLLWIIALLDHLVSWNISTSDQTDMRRIYLWKLWCGMRDFFVEILQKSHQKNRIITCGKGNYSEC